MDRLILDLRSAVRSLRTRTGASASIVALLSLAVGFAATMFALADPFVVKSLSYPSADQLLLLRTSSNGVGRGTFSTEAPPTIRDWRGRTELIQDLGYVSNWPTTVRAQQDGRSIRLALLSMDRQALKLLGQPEPLCESAVARCVLLTQSAFDRYGSGRSDFLGTLLPTARGLPVRITNILPAEFVLPSTFSPRPDGILLVPSETENLPVTNATLLARRQPHVSAVAVESALRSTIARFDGWTLRVEGIESALAKVSKPSAIAALAAAALILVVCIASATNLLFSQRFHRLGEFSTRRALGASNFDLFRLVTAELSVLAVLVACIGSGLAALALMQLRQVIPAQYVVLGEPHVNGRTLALSIVVSVVMLAASAIISSIALGRYRSGTLSKPPSGAQVGRLLRIGAVAIQSGLAMILVAGAVVLGRSYFNLFSQETGISGESVLIAASYPMLSSADLRRRIDDAVEHLRNVPGVAQAGATSGPGGLIDGPLRGGGASRVVFSGTHNFAGLIKQVTPAFFDAAGARIVSGRPLSSQDVNASAWVINQSFAKLNQTKIGESVVLGSGTFARPGTVVGVVQDLFDSSLDALPSPAVYRLLEEPLGDSGDDTRVRFVVRMKAGDPGLALASALAKSDPDIIITNVGTVKDRLAATVVERVFSTLVMAFFAVASVSVCVVGLVGVVAFVTARRARELAIRSALGASSSELIRAVSLDAAGASLVGLLLGLAAVRSASGLLQQVAYQIDTSTWSIGAVSGAIMLAIVLASVIVTARRALQLPIVAILRQQ